MGVFAGSFDIDSPVIQPPTSDPDFDRFKRIFGKHHSIRCVQDYADRPVVLFQLFNPKKYRQGWLEFSVEHINDELIEGYSAERKNEPLNPLVGNCRSGVMFDGDYISNLSLTLAPPGKSVVKSLYRKMKDEKVPCSLAVRHKLNEKADGTNNGQVSIVGRDVHVHPHSFRLWFDEINRWYMRTHIHENDRLSASIRWR